MAARDVRDRPSITRADGATIFGRNCIALTTPRSKSPKRMMSTVSTMPSRELGLVAVGK